jgi:hypothetical protein
MTKTYNIIQNGIPILSITIDQPTGVEYSDMQWDSRTGLVTAKINGGERKAIQYTGNSLGAIPPDPNGFTAENVTGISFRYWYY